MGSVKGHILVGAPLQPLTGDLSLRGAVVAPKDVTVYGVDVAGIAATSHTGDFDSWAATVPLSLLVQQADDQGQVTLAAHATTNCGGEPHEVGSLSVRVDVTPTIQVTQLSVIAALPNGQTYLPSSTPGSALITVLSNPASAGAVVMLATSLGTVTPAQVTLSGDGVAMASAMALFSSTVAGSAAVTASAKGTTAGTIVPVAGPPVVVPAGAMVPLGGSIRLMVLGAGRVESCQALPSPGFTVVSGTKNLMVEPGGIDVSGDGAIDIDVIAGADRTTPMQTTISCRDPFGQVGLATFAGPPP